MLPNCRQFGFAIFAATFISACGADTKYARLEEGLAALERTGLASKTCGPSQRFMQEQPELFPYGAGDWPVLPHARAAAKDAECRASNHLIKMQKLERGILRTYRCNFRGQQVEMLYGIGISKRDQEIYTFCNFAMSGNAPFKSDETYTGIEKLDDF